jgi:hypothetical protein
LPHYVNYLMAERASRAEHFDFPFRSHRAHSCLERWGASLHLGERTPESNIPSPRNRSHDDSVMFNACPLYPQMRTSAERIGMSALCQNRTHAVQQNSALLTRQITSTGDRGGQAVVDL